MEKKNRPKLPSPQERLDLILLGLARGKPVEILCQEAGVSRELFYRLMNRVRAAALKALEAKQPGPKTVSQPSEKELLKMRERLERQERDLAKLRKALTYEKLVVKTSQRIIRRNAWGPFPGPDAKKKDMRP